MKCRVPDSSAQGSLSNWVHRTILNAIGLTFAADGKSAAGGQFRQVNLYRLNQPLSNMPTSARITLRTNNKSYL
jgi:hypothetical protein